MKLKHRFPLYFSFLFSLILAAAVVVVYYLFANFREQEFIDRLSEKAETTFTLLVVVKEIDSSMLKIIDKNSVNRLYHEETQIFNDSLRMIYSSLDTIPGGFTDAELRSIKEKKRISKRDNQYDIVGLYYTYENKGYYVAITAEDRYGNRKLHFLKLLLIGAFICGTGSVWLLSFYLSKLTLKPLDTLRRQIQEVNTKNLTARIVEPLRKDEIKALSHSFNQMLERIDKAYKNQKDFTSNASHELRTPLAKIITQLENLMNEKDLTSANKTTLKSIAEDAYQLSDIVTSLLVLSKMESNEAAFSFKKIRIDEVIFSTATQLSNLHPDFKLRFEIENETIHELNMEVNGDETLLKIAVLNLLKNGYAYSNNHSVKCLVKQCEKSLQLFFINKGELPDVEDTHALFETFTRGSNSINKQGSGIGLNIVKRILDYHHATITYTTHKPDCNEICIEFPLIF